MKIPNIDVLTIMEILGTKVPLLILPTFPMDRMTTEDALSIGIWAMELKIEFPHGRIHIHRSNEYDDYGIPLLDAKSNSLDDHDRLYQLDNWWRQVEYAADDTTADGRCNCPGCHLRRQLSNDLEMINGSRIIWNATIPDGARLVAATEYPFNEGDFWIESGE